MENLNAKNNRIYYLLALVISLMLIIVGLFNVRSAARIKKQNNAYTKSVASEEAAELNTAIHFAKNAVEIYAATYLETGKHNSYVKNALLDRVFFLDINSQEAKELSEMDLCLRGFNGKSGMEVDFSRHLGKDLALVFYAPVMKQGRVLGVMVGTIGQQKMESILTSATFGVESDSFLMTSKGQIVSSSRGYRNYIGKNLFTNFHAKDKILSCSLDQLEGASLNNLALQNILHNGMSFGYSFERKGVEEHSYIVVLDDAELAVMKTFPKEVSAAMVGASRNDTLLVTALLLVLFGIIIYFVLKSHREQQEKQEQMIEMLKTSMREAQIANIAKTEFFSRMSHDMRTPLNGILGMADIGLRNQEDNQRLRDCLAKVKQSGTYLLGLINEVLDISKIEAGKIELKEEPFNFQDMTEEGLSVVRNLVGAKKLTFEESYDVIHNYVLGDRMQLEKIFFNLISNAVKYTPEGGKITVRMEEVPSNAEDYAKYTLTVSDTGIGMSPEYLKTIFEPFSRAEDVRVSKQQGTGLGMAITKNIVEMFKGHITVESELNKGTTFTVTIMLKIDKEEHTSKNIATGLTLEDLDCSSYRCMLVDDNELNREIAEELLSMTGMQVETAEDGQEAVELFKTKGDSYFDLIFMDVQMPIMNGYEATRAIRAIGSFYACSVPIIAMTANAYAEDVRDAMEAGMNAHMAKPIDLDRLVNIIAEHLEVKLREKQD